jgi:hypothetical protein
MSCATPRHSKASPQSRPSNAAHAFVTHIIQGVSKRALQLWKRIEINTEDIHNVLNCQNVAKHTEFYLG